MTRPSTGDVASAPWLTAGRIPGLDGLRAVSISLVILEHAIRQPDTAHVMTGVGLAGVSMFFTISGFLITLLITREWDRTGRISLVGFYRRRALRILPASISFLLIVFLLTRLDVFVLTRRDWIGALTYTMNFVEHPTWEVGHLWSLSIEEQFYLAWPVLVLMLTPGRSVGVILAYLLLAPAVRSVVLWQTDSPEVIEDLTLLHIDAIAGGCLLALVSSRERVRRRLIPASPRAALVTIGIATAVLVASNAAKVVAPFRLRFYSDTIRYSVDAVALAAIVWNTPFMTRTVVGRLLETSPARWVGVLSYSLYLWQQIFLHPYETRWFHQLPLALALAIGAAAVSYYVIERPFLRLKNRGETVVGVARARPPHAPDAALTRGESPPPPIRKKERLARLLGSPAGVRVLKPVFHRAGVLCLTHHRIAVAVEHDPDVISGTPSDLDEQAAWIQSHCTALGGSDVVDVLFGGRPLRGPAVALTFDDGYADNFAAGRMLMERYGIPATFFIPTAFIETDVLPPWDRIGYALRHTTRAVIHVEAIDGQGPWTIATAEYGTAITQAMRTYRSLAPRWQALFVEACETAAGARAPRGMSPFMSWDEIRQLRDMGHTIGAHTHSHPVLSALSTDEQQLEILQSKRTLEEQLGTSIEVFAYPYGKPGTTFTRETARVVETCGFRAAFSFYGGWNPAGRTQPFDIKRIKLDTGTTMAMFRTRVITRGWAPV